MKEYPYEKKVWGSILEDKAKIKRKSPFLYFKDEVFSYEEMNERANKMANGYRSMGVKKGDRVASMMPNCPEFIFHWFGLAKLGAVDTPLNTSYKGDLLRHGITNAGARILLVHEDFLDRIKFIEDELPTLEKLVVFSPLSKKIETKFKFEVIPFERVGENSADFSSSEEIKPSDHFIIVYTSGTTGPSKGVVLSHNALYCYTTDAIKMLGYDENDIMFSCLPLYHANIRIFTILVALINETAFAMSERYSARKFWDEIRKYNATAFCFLGGMSTFILNQPPRDDDADNPVRHIWGGPVSVDAARALEERFKAKVYCGFFGMTEASGITFIDWGEMEKLKTAGKWKEVLSMGRENKDLYEVKLVDSNDREVPPGENGEIICRPARPFSMITEYINMPEKTLEVFKNLWFHTGDMAKKDENGYFYFVDRKKDYMRRRGENVSSFEVEKVINSHPKIYDSAAIGIKSEVGEDEIMIVVKLQGGKSLVYEDLMGWCEQRMAYFMIPRYVRVIEDDFPRTPTGRIEKYKLRMEGITSGTWDREEAGYEIKR